MGIEFKDRISAFPHRYLMADAGGHLSEVYLERDDNPSEPGTPLNAETFNKFRDELKPLYIKVDDVVGVSEDAPISEKYTVNLTHEELHEAYFDDRLLMVHYLPNDAYIPMIYKRYDVGLSYIECRFASFSSSGKRYLVSITSSGSTKPVVTGFNLANVGVGGTDSGSDEGGTGGNGLSIYYTSEKPVMSSGGSALFYPIAIRVPEGRTLQVGDMIYSSATNTLYMIEVASTGTGVANYCTVLGSLQGKTGASIYPSNVGDNPSWIEPSKIMLPEGREAQIGDMLLDTPTGNLYRVKNILSQDVSTNFIQIELLATMGSGGGGGVSIYETNYIAISENEVQISEDRITLPAGAVLKVGDMLFNPVTSKWFRITYLIPPSQSSTYISVTPMSTALTGGAGGNSGAFFIQTIHENGRNVTIDKTIFEIVAAFGAGLTPIIRYKKGAGYVEQFFVLKYITEDKSTAAFTTFENGTEYQIIVVGDEVETWVYGECVIEKEYALKSDISHNDSTLYVEVYDLDDGSYYVGKSHTEIEDAYGSGRNITVIHNNVVDSSVYYLPLGSRRAVGGTSWIYVFSQVISGVAHIVTLTADATSDNYPSLTVQNVENVTVAINNEEVVQNVLAALPTWEGGNY